MAVCLSKGQKVDLTKGNPGLKKITVGLGWDVNRYDGGYDFDLDASAFLLGANGKVPSDGDFVFYGNASHASEAVVYGGDNRTGEGEGDDEQISVDLTLVPDKIDKIDFTVTIYDADVRRQNFGQVSNAYVRIVDEATGDELIRYDLEEDYSIETALVVGEIYRHNGGWKFNAIGSGYQGGLAALYRSKKTPSLLPEGVDENEENLRRELIRTRLELERLKKGYTRTPGADGRPTGFAPVSERSTRSSRRSPGSST